MDVIWRGFSNRRHCRKCSREISRIILPKIAKEANIIRIKVKDIKIHPSRRVTAREDIEKLSKSVSDVDLLNPITIDQDHNLIAGLHRLEAVKRLGWEEIECTVTGMEGLQAELAEIDENIIRSELSAVEYGKALLRRKEIYETLHPETRVTYEGGRFKGNQHTNGKLPTTEKSFAKDTADKLGVTARTVERYVRMAKDLTPDVRILLSDSDVKLTQSMVRKLSRLKPGQQKEAAVLLAAQTIQSVDEYLGRQTSDAHEQEAEEDCGPTPERPFCLKGKQYATIRESVTDLKNMDKDCGPTVDIFLAGLTSEIELFQQSMQWYTDSYYEVVFPDLSQIQIDYLQRMADTVYKAVTDVIDQVKEKQKTG